MGTAGHLFQVLSVRLLPSAMLWLHAHSQGSQDAKVLSKLAPPCRSRHVSEYSSFMATVLVYSVSQCHQTACQPPKDLSDLFWL